MKKYLLTTMGLSVIALFGMNGFTANAEDPATAVPSEATTQGKMTFKIDDSEMTPDNPNVNKPDQPDETFDPENVKPDSPNSPGAGGTGKRSFYINFAPNLKFNDVVIKGSDMTHMSAPLSIEGKEYAPFVQVTDNRGSGDGWDLTLQSTTFKEDGGTEELKGVSLNFKPDGQVNPMIPMDSQSLDLAPTGLPAGDTLQVGSEDSFTIMSAAEGTGVGSWTYSFGGTETSDAVETLGKEGGLYQEGKGVQITVPASSLPKINKVYVSDLTWTLTATPTGD